MKNLSRIGPALLLVFVLSGCESMYALEHALQEGAKNHPGGPIAFGSDLVSSSAATIQPVLPRRR